MKAFAITVPDYNVTVCGDIEAAKKYIAEAGAGSVVTDPSELQDWPAADLLELWNSLPGNTPVKKFETRGIGVRRIWNSFLSLNGNGIPSTAPAADLTAAAAVKTSKGKKPKTDLPKRVKGEKKPRASRKSAAPKDGNKGDIIVALISRKGGATLDELMKETGWQRHSVRGFMSNLKRKHGIKYDSFRNDKKERVYSKK